MGENRQGSTPSTVTPHNDSQTADMEWTPQTILSLVSVPLLAILTVFGNALVIVAVAKYKRLQIPSNYILINLAVADIAVAVFTSWVLVAELTGFKFQNLYVCILPYCLVALGCGVSLVTLSMVAYDRYAALVKPLKYYQHITSKRVLCFSFITWLYILVIAFAPLCWHYFVENQGMIQARCSFYLLQRYMVLFQVVMVFAPSFVVMIGCYCHVTLVARHHSRAISAIQLSLFPNSLNKNFHMFRGNKYSRTLLIILGFFCLTWVTFVSSLLVECFCDICRTAVPLHKYSVFLIFSNSCLNPWIYAHRNQDFKAAFSRLLRTLCCRKWRPQSTRCGTESRRNSHISDALSRTNSMVGEFQHLQALYNNADMVPAMVSVETCQKGMQIFRPTPKLIQHDISNVEVKSFANDISTCSV